MVKEGVVVKRSEMTCEKCIYSAPLSPRIGGICCTLKPPEEEGNPRTDHAWHCGQGLWPNPEWAPDSTYRKRYLVWGVWEDEG